MDDIVKRLRDKSGRHIHGLYDDEAADEIERLRADAARLEWLIRMFGVTKLPCMLEPVVGDYVPDGTVGAK